MFKGFMTPDNKTVYINTNNIIAIQDNYVLHKKNGNVDVSLVYLSSGCNVNVLGKAEDILEYIEG